MRLPFKTFLLASAGAATLAVPALAESYFFRTKPLVEAPGAFSFASAVGKNPGTVVESAVARISGYRGKTAAVTGGEYQVCAAADCAGATWTSAPTANLPPEFHARIRATAPAFGATATARLTVGDASAAFEIASRVKDTDPDPVTFAKSADVQPNTSVTSGIVRLTGHDGITVSAANALYRVCTSSDCTVNGGWRSAATEAAPDTWVQLQVTSPAAGTSTDPAPALNYGGRTATWVVSSAASSGATYAAMGITDTRLADALANAVGGQADWIQCNYGGTGATETCAGARETLVVYTGTTYGHTFGVYVKGDIAGKVACWYNATGLYFSNSPTMGGYVRNDTSSGLGTVGVCNAPNSGYMFLYGLYWLRGGSPMNHFPNGEYMGPSITGAPTGTAVSGTVKWYKRL